MTKPHEEVFWKGLSLLGGFRNLKLRSKALGVSINSPLNPRPLCAQLFIHAIVQSVVDSKHIAVILIDMTCYIVILLL